MKIKSVSAKEKSGWNIVDVNFNCMLTLLVGASGVGKTKILDVISRLSHISRGESVNAFSWKVVFEHKCTEYVWEGEFEDDKNSQSIFRLDEKDSCKIVKEIIYENNEIIVNRSSYSLIYKNQKLIKLDDTKSVVYLLKEEESIKPIYIGFQNCYKLDTGDNTIHISPIVDISKRTPLNVSMIKQMSYFSPMEKLFLLKENKIKEFDVIVGKFKDIFPTVNDVDFTMAKGFNDMVFPILRIKERNVSEWIVQMNISSGMLRTLIQITMLVLSNDGDVIMIDEFENGLGVNCINDLADLVMEPESNVQIIMTSHHPYIINTIPVKNWMIITRNGSNVNHDTAHQLRIGEHSKHDAFMQLIQTHEFKTGLRRSVENEFI